MIFIDSNEVMQKLISENQMMLVYFGNVSCDVCNAIKPKIEEILKNYPKIKGVQVDTEIAIKLSAYYSIYTIPVILIFVEGKEIIREARYISLQEIDRKIERYYELLFQ